MVIVMYKGKYHKFMFSGAIDPFLPRFEPLLKNIAKVVVIITELTLIRRAQFVISLP